VPVKLLIGREGSGKTRWCLDRTVAMLGEDPLGKPIYWLLPRQATFQAERRLACAAGLRGFCRARVLSFDTLGQELLEEVGGIAVPEITPLGRQMILGHLLRRHRDDLQFYGPVARHVTLAARLDQTIHELERAGKDPSQVEQLVGELRGKGEDDLDAQSLALKLSDIGLIYNAYHRHVGQNRLDPRRRMEQVLWAIGRSSLLRGSTVFVDDFADFDEFQRRCLARLAGMAQVWITLLIDPDSPALRQGAGGPWDELGLFFHIEETYRRLLKTFADEGVEVEHHLLRDTGRAASSALAQIERAMFDFTARPQGDPTGLEMLEAPDRRAEVDAAARRIQQHLAHGLRLRDIAVIVRRLDLYGDLIATSFREHGIRHFIDRRRTMSHHPLLRLVRESLTVARGDWPREAVMSILKCGLSLIEPRDADALENYVIEHRVRGRAWMADEPWTWRRQPGQSEDEGELAPEAAQVQHLDALRRGLVLRLAPLLDLGGRAVPLPVREIAAAVCLVLERFEVRRQLAAWIDQARARGLLDEADEHLRVWTELSELLTQMVDLLGDESVALAGFQEILESALESFDLGVAPPAVDEVLVGQIDRSRTPDVRAVLLLGLNDGVFPHAPREGSMLADVERIELRRRGFEVEPDTQRRLLDEALLAYIALTRPSHWLFVSRVASDDAGRPLGPSPYWRRLRELYPALSVQVIPREVRWRVDLVGTPRQLVTGVMAWVGRDPSETTDESWPALYDWMSRHAQGPIQRLRDLAWPALRHANDPRLSPRTSRGLFPDPLHASVARIETIAACPFRHFARYGLQLKERQSHDPTYADLDYLYHQALRRLVEHLLAGNRSFASLSTGEAQRLIQGYTQQIAQHLRGELMLSTARNAYLLSHVTRVLERVVGAQKAIAQRGGFAPTSCELRFGPQEGSHLPPLDLLTPKGRTVLLHGRMDRVDTIEREAAAAVVDYRLNGGQIDLARVYYGLSLRMLAYLLVVREHAKSSGARALTPAGATYLRLIQQLHFVNHPSEAPPPLSPLDAIGERPRGIVRSDFVAAYDRELEQGWSPVVGAFRLKGGGLSKSQGDVVDPAEMDALLDHAREKLATLADGILDGQIDVRPYRLAQVSPCSTCPYLSVCRFDTSVNQYQHLHPMSKENVLDRLMKGGR
jgi:ATP-dependent helicase/nuclease subunit B